MTRNIERLEVLAAHLEGVRHFDMTEFFHTCGSPSCMMGYAVAVAGMNASFYTEELCEYYGITEEEYDCLAYPGSVCHRHPGVKYYTVRGYRIDNIQAAKVIRHFAATGEINHLIGME